MNIDILLKKTLHKTAPLFINKKTYEFHLLTTNQFFDMRKILTNPFHQFYKNKSRYFIGLLFLLSGTIVNAQNINWTSGYPKLDSTPIVVLEDDRTLQIRFTPLAGNINNANIEVQLPPNVEYISASSPTAGVTLTTTASGTLATGKLITINVTSNSNRLLQNTEVQFNVKVNANCAAAGASTFDVKIKSGPTLVTSGQKDLTANIVVPSLALTSSDGTINYSNQTDKNTITYYLKTNTADKASSAKVVFTTDLKSTLSNFKLGATSFTPTVSTSGSNRTYTFEFTPSFLGSKIDNTNNKKITFDGESTQCGSHVITANVQFPYNANCATATGSMVTMAFGSLPVPQLDHVSSSYVNASDVAIANTAINMDGVTPTLVKAVFKNNGGSDAMNIVYQARPYGQWAYIDTDNIYVEVQGSARRKVTASEIAVTARRGNNANYSYYKTGIAGVKAHTINIKVAESVPPGSTITYWVPTINGDIHDNGTRNIFHDYHTNTINGFVTNITSMESPCGDAGITTIVSNRIAYLNAPHYRQLLPSMNIKASQTRTLSIHVSPGTGNAAASEFHIQHPTWLSISAPVTMTQNRDGTGTAYTLTTVPGGPDETVVRYTGGNLTTAYLHVTYTSGTCGGTNQTGKIHYWVNQMWPHPLQKISQVFQDVTLECEMDGITLDEFKVTRKDKGLKDSNNDRIPDDGSTAPDADIRHDAYVEGDRGEFYWEGTTTDATTRVIDIPVKATGFTLAESGSSNVLFQQEHIRLILPPIQ